MPYCECASCGVIVDDGGMRNGEFHCHKCLAKGGKVKTIMDNWVSCLKCGDVIVSDHTYDFKRCVCGAIAIDGGKEYTRLTWGGDRPPFTPNLKMEHYIGFHPTYTKTANFLLKYSWSDKSEQVIVEEMALNSDEQGYLREAMEELRVEGKFTGWDLDRLILHKIDKNQDDGYDPEDVIFIQRDDFE